MEADISLVSRQTAHNASSFQTPSRSVAQTSGLLSPSGRRMLYSLGSASKGSPIMSAEVLNDDQLEKRQKILESAKKKKAEEEGPVPQEKVPEHYHNCLKLAAQNKITTKNAFNLHLIDYMNEMLLRSDEVDFQLAALSLEAGSKIYSCRVDALHTEIHRMVATLNRMILGDDDRARKKGPRRDDPEADDAEDDLMDDEEGGHVEGGGDASIKPKKKNDEAARQRKPKKTIETNVKNITTNDGEMNLEMDTYFRRTRLAFEPGNTSKLLLNSLYTWNDTCELILDPRRVVIQGEADGSTDKEKPNDECQVAERVANQSKLIDISEFSDIFSHILKSKPKICSALENFKFGAEGEDLYRTQNNKEDLERFRFDVNAEFEWPVEVPFEVDDQPFGFDDFNDDGDRMSLQDKTNFRPLEETISLVKSRDMTAIQDALTRRPSEYSSFLKKLLKEVDPEKWKALQKKVKDKEDDKQNKKKKKAKVDFLVTFEDEDCEEEEKEENNGRKRKKKDKTKELTSDDTNWHFRKPKRMNTHCWDKILGKDELELLLPDEPPYDADELKRLYFMPEIKIERQPLRETRELDVENYDYANDNDVNNYCPDDGDAASANMDFGDAPFDDVPFDDAPFDDFRPIADDDAMTRAQQRIQEAMNTQEGKEELIGNNLVPEPRTIPRIRIDYDKVAKNIDVKKLRTTMFQTINNLKKSLKEIPLAEIINSMSGDLPKATRDDLSIHIAFFCLLNLANENNFVLSPKDDMSDIVILKTD